MPYAESRERFAETLDIIRRAWTEDTFSYDGKYFRYHETCVVPKPYQKPHPPIRVAATSADTFPPLERKALTCSPRSHRDARGSSRPTWRSTGRRSLGGRAGKGSVFFRVPVYVADTFDRAVEDCRESILAFYRQLGEELERSARDAGRAPSSSAMCAAAAAARRPSTRCCEKR